MTEQEHQALNRLTTILSPLLNQALAEANTLATLLNRGPGGREVSLAITNMQQARHWLLDAKLLILGPPEEESEP